MNRRDPCPYLSGAGSPRIAALYCGLAAIDPSPIVELNRAVAVAMAYDPLSGLAVLAPIAASGVLQDYHLFHAARRPPAPCRSPARSSRCLPHRARTHQNAVEQAFLKRRLSEVEQSAV